jgi:hypothetical protein
MQAYFDGTPMKIIMLFVCEFYSWSFHLIKINCFQRYQMELAYFLIVLVCVMNRHARFT